MRITLDQYLDAIFEEGLVSSKSGRSRHNLSYYLDYLFKKVDLENKTVLDVGGGSGIFSFYAACRGAREVVCLEPEASGSRSGMLDKFRRTQTRLGLDRVRLEPVTFQSFDPG